jgi:3-dehydroquinate dehydratase-2
MKKVYVINGPNLNLLGTREPEIYGKNTLKDIIKMLKKAAKNYGVSVSHFQSNHEGKLIDKLHKLSKGKIFGVIINPGALTHYSYSLSDAIKATGLKVVEVHISDIENREDFRKISVTKDACIGQVKGLGAMGYLKALELLIGEKNNNEKTER